MLLYKYAGPIIRKSFADRTAGVQTRIDDSAAAKVAADTEAARIREAQGDIEAERARLHAEAETQAAALLADGRARLDVEMAELEARAETDIAAAAGVHPTSCVPRSPATRAWRSTASSPTRSTTPPTRR